MSGRTPILARADPGWALCPDLALVEDLAVRLRVAPGTVRSWCASGRIPAGKIGRRWVIERHLLLDSLRADARRRKTAREARATGIRWPVEKPGR